MKWQRENALAVIDTSSSPKDEYVILLHGLARTHRSMTTLALALNAAGYHTINFSYPSTQYHIAKLAEDAITAALAQCPKGSKVHFVTHSMGGILVRQYLHLHTIENLGRVVMLGPPNKGSEVVDRLKTLPGFKFINGPAGMQLGTRLVDQPRMLGAANFDVGIIAGTRSFNLLLSSLLPTPNDGKVSVASTLLDDMSDHIAIAVTHTFMMKNKIVIAQVLHFLMHGKFNH
ncbi:esterase/lipase family protein [Shewanella sp. MF05960]|uniref:esterase/lipase family protein n=1 Tax=Shewanella sp. MF05960 TaxID=3434874 RepID=UPI003D7C0452